MFVDVEVWVGMFCGVVGVVVGMKFDGLVSGGIRFEGLISVGVVGMLIFMFIIDFR